MLPIDPFSRSLPRRSRGWFIAAIVAVLIVLTAPAHGQSPSPTPTPSPSPAVTPSVPALDLNSLFSNRTNSTSRGIVRLDGRKLFTVAAPAQPATPAQGSRPAQQTRSDDPIDLRIEAIEERLQTIAESNFAPDSLRVTSAVDRTSRLPVISVRYRVNGDDRTQEILTVTTLDTEIHATDADTLASGWSDKIRSALVQARIERQPSYLQRQVYLAAVILLGICLVSALLMLPQRRLAIRREALLSQSRTEKQELSTIAPGTETETRTALLQEQLENREQRGIVEIQRRLLQFGQLATWGGGGFLILGLFPFSRRWQPIAVNLVQIPFKILAIAFGTYLAIRFSGVLVDRLFLLLQDSTSIAPEASQRLALRFSTISRVGKSIIAVMILGLGIIIALSVINVQVGPLLAGAGIIGLAISFASQSLIKDILNGFFILLEDQYGVGDVIIVGDVSGFVENMNLRITQLRNEEGRLITIPNSSISIVQNLSKEWARVDLRVDVAYSADLDQALALIEQIAQDMSHDRPWNDLILEPPLLLGVDELDNAGATVRLWIKTQPLKQWEVAREYRRRLKVAFDKAGIPFGIPQQALMLHSDMSDDDSKDSPVTRFQGK
ncbi:mechanosensitive ion channel family protein [Microcoleus sp. FACHB-1515]|uniref:mechanosensitive ion channel family protein n=1 Tax=Cyanophyceae TaxID=3028117 RepID=UPI00168827B5|nr:mechanosensitive ion channel family protein [Microcoleus sp. FACHB-1515]MBD2090356.1 mechanosensitive ion channel family protein [Microcoleus sp. FACHB-1515]